MIITPPFTEMQKKVIEATEKLANKKMLCDIDGVDDIVVTNFDRITASPEALAEFISKETIKAWFAQANNEQPRPNGSKEWLKWLKQESEE